MKKDVLIRIYERLNEGSSFDEEILIDAMFELEALRKENKQLKEEQERRFKIFLEANNAEY